MTHGEVHLESVLSWQPVKIPMQKGLGMVKPIESAIYSQYAKLGVEMGNDYAGKHKNDITKLQLINDYIVKGTICNTSTLN